MNEKNKYFEIVKEIEEKLLNFDLTNLHLSKKHNDGRINSSLNEKEFINFLKENNFFKEKIKEPFSERNWFDISFNFKKDNIEYFFPINIKIIEGNKNDNLNCKLGIYYSLTGMIPFFSNEINWDKYFKYLKENESENYKDYYFLVLNKNTKKIIFKGLKEIDKFNISGNNLPFQCNFEKTTYSKKEYSMARQLILNSFYEGIKKRTNIRDSFEFYFINNQIKNNKNKILSLIKEETIYF